MNKSALNKLKSLAAPIEQSATAVRYCMSSNREKKIARRRRRCRCDYAAAPPWSAKEMLDTAPKVLNRRMRPVMT